MAILQTTLRFSDTQAGSDSDGQGSGSMDTTRSWDVLTSADASEWEVMVLTPTPKRGYPHPDNPFLRVRRVRVERRSPIHWIYFADYELTDNGTDSGDPNDPIGNPLLQPPVIRYSHEEVEEEIDEDEDGKPIVNVNNEPFPKRTRLFGYRIITIEKNVASFNASEKDEYFFCTNSSGFLNYAAGRLLLKSIDGDPVTDGGFTYYKQIATIASRTQAKLSSADRAWWMRMREEGFLVYTGQQTNSGRFIFKHAEKDGDRVSQPVLLDIDGREETDPQEAMWSEFRRYPAKSFAAANIL